IAGGVLAFALVAAGCSSTALPPSTSPSPSASASPAVTATPAGSIATQPDSVAAGATHIDVAGEPDWLAVAGGSAWAAVVGRLRTPAGRARGPAGLWAIT